MKSYRWKMKMPMLQEGLLRRPRACLREFPPEPPCICLLYTSLNAGDSRVISAISIHLILPCVILNAFQVEFSPEVKEGLFLSLVAAVIINVGLIVLVTIFSGILRLDAVEQVSVIYSNAGNLVIPIVSAILGSEWVIYSSVFLAVQM